MKKTQFAYIPLFATPKQLAEAEKKKAQLENEGWKLIQSGCGGLTYQKGE